MAMIRNRIRQVASDEHGGIAIMAAFMMPVLVGGMALGAETGYWYMQQRKLQHAADMAAYAGAIRAMQGDTKGELTTTAVRVGRCTWDKNPLCQTSPVTVSITINTPYGGDPTKVEAIAQESVPRYLTALFGSGPVALSGRAVAKFTLDTGANGCVLALNRTAPVGVKVSGNTSVTFSGCEVVSNSGSDSSFMMQSGSAVVTTDCIRVSGEASTNAAADINLKCEKIAEGRPAILDPYAEVPEPSTAVACVSGTSKVQVGPKDTTAFVANQSHPSGLPAMNFCGGLRIQGTATFAPGIYLIAQDFTINAGATINVVDNDGDGVTEGVMFYLYDGAGVTMNGQANLTLTPITEAQSADYAGLLFYSQEGNTAQVQINGGSSSNMTGTVYAQDAEIQFAGNTASGTGGCMQLVGGTIEFTGNSGVSADCSSIGGKTIYSNPSAALVE